MEGDSKVLREDLENEQICSITQEPFQDPVVTMDGHTYERTAILKWFEKYQTSPKTNLKLPSKEIIPNHALRNMITNFIPKFLIRYEDQKQQMQRQIQQLKINYHELQKKLAQIPYYEQLEQKQKQLSQIKEEYQTEIKKLKQKIKILYERLLGQKQKQTQQLKVIYQDQKRKNQKQFAQLQKEYEKQIQQQKQRIKIKNKGQLGQNQKQQKKSKQQKKINQLGQKQLKKRNKIQQKQRSQKSQMNGLKLKNSNKVSLDKLLKQSSILDKEGLQLLCQWLIKPISKIQLKFKASSNGFQMDKYYKQCGDLKNTIIIVKTTKGKIIGGYTPLSFNPPGNKWTYHKNQERIKDESNSSFLFSLSEKQKFYLNKDKYAIKRLQYKGYITFFDTFRICDQSDTNQINYFDLNHNMYNTQKYRGKQVKITGQDSKYFTTEQWQVYQVYFT